MFPRVGKFDAVVSGINRGDNCGMHVVYSGTVGAAREGAMLGIPSLALSLDNYRGPSDYADAAALAVPLVRAVLGLLPLPGLGEAEAARAVRSLRGCVVNVNFPMRPLADTRGYFVTFHSLSTLMLHWSEVLPGDAPGAGGASRELEQSEVDLYQGGGSLPGADSARRTEEEEDEGEGAAGPGPLDVAPRVFRKRFGQLVFDETPASDAWAMHHGYASVTLLALQQDVVGAHREAYEACAAARGDAPAGPPGGLSPSPGPRPTEFHTTLPLDFVGDAPATVAARFGDERLPSLCKVVEAAAVHAGKAFRAWTSFRTAEEARRAAGHAAG